MSTFNIIKELSTADKKALIIELRDSIKMDRIIAREMKADARREKQAIKALKAQDRIEKARARLQKLLDAQNPVGAKAIKANRKPSKVAIIK